MRNPSKNTIKRIVKIYRHNSHYNAPDWISCCVPHLRIKLNIPLDKPSEFKLIKLRKSKHRWVDMLFMDKN